MVLPPHARSIVACLIGVSTRSPLEVEKVSVAFRFGVGVPEALAASLVAFGFGQPTAKRNEPRTTRRENRCVMARIVGHLRGDVILPSSIPLASVRRRTLPPRSRG